MLDKIIKNITWVIFSLLTNTCKNNGSRRRGNLNLFIKETSHEKNPPTTTEYFDNSSIIKDQSLVSYTRLPCKQPIYYECLKNPRILWLQMMQLQITTQTIINKYYMGDSSSQVSNPPKKHEEHAYTILVQEVDLFRKITRSYA